MDGCGTIHNGFRQAEPWMVKTCTADPRESGTERALSVPSCLRVVAYQLSCLELIRDGFADPYRLSGPVEPT